MTDTFEGNLAAFLLLLAVFMLLIRLYVMGAVVGR